LKKSLAAAVVLVTSLALSGCSTAAPNQQMFDTLKSTCGTYKTGSEVKKVKVSSDMTKAPTVDFMTPIDAAKPTLQTEVIVDGSGPKITGGQFVSWDYAVFSGLDKTQITTTKFNGTDSPQQMVPSSGDLCKALAGVHEGSRIALLVPSEVAGTSATGKVSSQVWVFDIKKVFLPHAVGDVKSPENGMPVVIRATDGRPSVTIPKGAAPSSFKRAVTIEGKGDPVKAGQNILVHYTGYLWNGTTFDSSWESGQPAKFTVDAQHLIPGFVKALTGIKVGSQVIAVIPPALGYGAAGNGTIPGNSTLVFVVDVLGIVK
jgi:FKBP-type peptidyl-prolyl cis-trans isomerase